MRPWCGAARKAAPRQRLHTGVDSALTLPLGLSRGDTTPSKVYWSPEGYRVAVDGVWKDFIPTAGYVGSAPNEVILSLLVNNDDVSELNTSYPTDASLAGHVMTVDWIRVWR